MVGMIREMLFSMRRKNPALDMINKKEAFKNKTPLQKNIYGGNELGSSYERDDKVHYGWKYKVVVPLLKFAIHMSAKLSKWKLGKFIKKGEDIPKERHDKNFVIFHEAYERAIRLWIDNYTGYMNGKREKFSKEKIEKEAATGCPQMLRILKELALTMTYYDTAYREFFNMLMHEIALGMLSEYKGKKVSHVIYNSGDIYHPVYFQMQMEMQRKEQIEASLPEDRLAEFNMQMDRAKNQIKELKKVIKVAEEEVRQRNDFMDIAAPERMKIHTQNVLACDQNIMNMQLQRKKFKELQKVTWKEVIKNVRKESKECWTGTKEQTRSGTDKEGERGKVSGSDTTGKNTENDNTGNPVKTTKTEKVQTNVPGKKVQRSRSKTVK